MQTKLTKRPSFVIQTLGCKVNQYDSEQIRTQLLRQGYRSVTDGDAAEPELIIVNTCSVTSESDRKGRQLIRKLIRQYPHARVAVTGCYSERKPQEILRIGGVDDVVPIEQQNQWIERLAEELGWGCEDQDALWDSPLVGIDQFSEHTRAFVKIQDGCDLKCTFCSIPESRGRARSRLMHEVIGECERLVSENGYPEIVLCGICIGHYGRENGETLHDLVRAVARIQGIKRVRISSLEPQDVTDELLRVMLEHQNVVCPHLHLPLQSGSNKILRRMKRMHTMDFFYERIDLARQWIPHFELSTDIMVGFPGETDDDFAQTLDAVRRSRFHKVHAFRFSARDDTPAMKMSGHLHPTIVEARRRELNSVSEQVANEVKSAYIGTIQPVLAELNEEGKNTGFTANYIRVDFNSERPVQRGELIPVLIAKLHSGRLFGTPIIE